MEGWRMGDTPLLAMWPPASPRPTVVVVLPSPSGVGVIAETTTYFAFGRSFISSIAASLIFATSWPYGSRRCGPMPIFAATSAMGSRRARRAISRSFGNAVFAISALLFFLCLEAGQHLAPPPLRRLDLVEREDVQAGGPTRR